jgi:CTP:molybdopterin cytidylyltransferase MocA
LELLFLVDKPGVTPEQWLAVAQNFAEKKGTVFVVFGKAAMGDAGRLQPCAGERSVTGALIDAVKRTVAVKSRS